MCEKWKELVRNYNQRCLDIANDPFAIAGSVVGDLLEGFEDAFPGEIRRAMDSGEICEEHGMMLLGEIAQNRFDRKVYGGG